MTLNPGVSSQDLKRIQELFKYFLSTANSIGYPDGDIDCADAYDPKVARISSDPVLNALAQLTACRLSCDRAFVSLIDSEHQHIIAEATREISLYESTHHPPGMGLCIGSRPLDLFSGVCASTMPAFTESYSDGPYTSTSNVYADHSRYVINDFTLEEKYKDRPYVTGFPFMRYYAEVPIRGPSGLVIGTLAVVDNKPRVGLCDEGFFVLNEMSMTIMKHLEKVKAQQDHVQATVLLRGLRTFVQAALPTDQAMRDNGTESASQRMSEGALGLHEKQTKDIKSTEPSTMPTSTSAESSNESGIMTLSSGFDSFRLESLPTQDTGEDAAALNVSFGKFSANPSLALSPPNLGQDPGSGRPSKLETPHDPGNGKGTRLRKLVMSDDIRSNFAKASYILRQALDLDGVAFLDAALSGFASRSDIALSSEDYNLRSHPDVEDSSSEMNDDDAPLIGSPTGPEGFAEERNLEEVLQAEGQNMPSLASQPRTIEIQMSGILGQSTRKEPEPSESITTSERLLFPELLLQGLLRHYPSGHVFDFTQIGAPRRGSAGTDTFDERRLSTGVKSTRRMLKRRDVENILREALPGVRSAIFVPLWNPHKDTWLAGGIGWTNKEKRVLEKDDLAYFSVFGNSIMAEVARLELADKDRAKSNFISSISHELRSPLHGILGSAELLRDSDPDEDQRQMIRMIENCGFTMLDTMDHILDFAKLNTSAAKSQARRGKHKIGQNETQSADDGQDSSLSFDLDRTIEDTVESLVAGHRYNNASSSHIVNRAQPRSYAVLAQSGSESTRDIIDTDTVTVVVDIEKQRTWHVRSEISSWRRIILNLLGNALKYTSTGLIEITLRARNADGSTHRDNPEKLISLIIRDTGRGIGKAYLSDHLYTPFVQENELSSGTGLGLSIVQKLVHNLDGVVNVHSEVGVGTKVDVHIPLTILPERQESTPLPPQLGRGTLCVLGFSVYPSLNTEPNGFLSNDSQRAIAIKTSIENCAKHWCGLEVISAPDSQPPPANIVVISDQNLHLLEAKDEQGNITLGIPSGSALIIISTGSSHDMKYSCDSTNRLQYAVPPLGPNRMKDCIENALLSDRSAAARGTKRLSESAETLRQTTTSPAIARHSNTKPTRSNDLSATKQTEIFANNPETPQSKKPNVLVVDDNDVNLKLLVAHMRKLGCNYTTAKNGQEAFEAYTDSQQPFDCVFMDVSMPVMDGFASTRAIRDHERANDQPPTPIIALTGLGSPAAEQEAFTSGVNHFWTKPVPMKRIRALIEQDFENMEKA